MLTGALGRVHEQSTPRSTEQVLEAVGDLRIPFREQVAAGVVGHHDRRGAMRRMTAYRSPGRMASANADTCSGVKEKPFAATDLARRRAIRRDGSCPQALASDERRTIPSIDDAVRPGSPSWFGGSHGKRRKAPVVGLTTLKWRRSAPSRRSVTVLDPRVAVVVGCPPVLHTPSPWDMIATWTIDAGSRVLR